MSIASQFLAGRNLRSDNTTAQVAQNQPATSVPILPAADQTREDQIGDPISGQSRYDFNYKAFPNDLGTDYARDYMIININVPVNSAGTDQRGVPTGSLLTGELSTVDRQRNLTGGTGAASPGIAGGGTVDASNPAALLGAAAGGYSLSRRTRRIAESIAIFMPSGGLVYNYQNKYEEISMTALTGKVIAGGASAIGGLAAGILGRSFERAQQGSATAGAITNAAGRVLSQTQLLNGFPINPRVEVLFSHNDLRQFRFDFLMAPRNVRESETIKDIIKILRLNSVPEISQAAVAGLVPGGFTYIPPAEFDISIYHNNAINPHIPRINTCVLTVIEVQYDPTDGIFSTFSNGHPVAVRMTLGFQEVEPLHKTRINQGF
jgi:hypothetical protein